MKDLLTIVLCFIGTCTQGELPKTQTSEATTPPPIAEIIATPDFERYLEDPFDERSLSGNYLAGQFAQSHHDWGRAVKFLTPLIELTPENAQLLNKAMVLAMGSGQTQRAIDVAYKITEMDDSPNSLAILFTALDSFHKKNYQDVITRIEDMPEGSLSNFILPLLKSWAYAGIGENRTESLDENTIHIHHAILISTFLRQEDKIKNLLAQALSAQGLSLQDLERVADVYAHLGEHSIALELYQKVFKAWPENRPIKQKIEALENTAEFTFLKAAQNPEQGVAEALYDMSRLLFQEYSDDSARVFAHMALLLNPKLTDAQLLLGYITARNEQYEQAIQYYRKVTPDNLKYTEAQRMAADLMEDTNRTDEALITLENLVRNYNDLEALIQIGDIYRRNEEFGKAVATYDRAIELIGGEVPQEYWQLLYVRGISHERLGHWNKAEKDLVAALEYQPNHPLILNYLGYAWADQGINLKQSLDYIRKAAALEPTDGYITDSLGWVLYRMGQYKEAIPHLEKAVELLPYDPIINDHLGDIYWKVDRKLEARFQWVRAKNHAKDEKLISTIKDKLENGLQKIDTVEEASTHTDEKIDVFKP